MIADILVFSHQLSLPFPAYVAEEELILVIKVYDRSSG